MNALGGKTPFCEITFEVLVGTEVCGDGVLSLIWTMEGSLAMTEVDKTYIHHGPQCRAWEYLRHTGKKS